MLTSSEARRFPFVFVTAALMTASIGLPHGQSGKSERNIDQDTTFQLEMVLDEKDHHVPQIRDTAGEDDDEEHESIVFIDGGKAQWISKTGDKPNIDEMGLDRNAHAGDILGEDFMPEDVQLISKRKAAWYQYAIWPNAIVPWYFDPTRAFTLATSKARVWDAIYHWQNMTCLRFPYRNSDAQYLKIGTGTGCSSFVGRQYNPQNLNLKEYGCTTLGIIAHEIGHAIGFYHEQSRKDRDDFVDILWDNIPEEKKYNFNKVPTLVPVEYDLESIMHYGLKACSMNGQPTIKAKRQELSFLAGNRRGLTFYDAKMANLIYNCKGDCNNKCHNHGYPFKTPNNQCVCKCPVHLSGDCNRLDTATTDCGGVYKLTAADPIVTIKSPNFPNNYNLNKLCVYVIKAPDTAGSGIELKFSDFDVTGSSYRCNHFVQINANLIGQTGVKYCGSFSGAPQGISTFLDHNSTEMMVIFNSKDTTASVNKGFKFTAKFVGAIGSTTSPTTMPPSTTLPTTTKVTTSESTPAPTTQSSSTTLPPTTTTTPRGSSPGPTSKPPTTTSGPTVPVDGISCTFDDGHLCGWKQATDDNFDWSPNSGGTHSPNTGPSGGDQGTGYIYAEVTLIPFYSIAKIYTDYFAPGDYRFSFKWHMYGGYFMGNLTLSMVTKSGKETILFQKAGNHGDVWQSSSVDVVTSEETKLVIAGTKIQTWQGDIALDTFVFEKKVLLTCDFENGALCKGFANAPNADYTWVTRTGGTPSARTGPSSAYEGNYYVYAEANNVRRGKVARLLLTPSTGTPFTLTWAYHMYGKTMGSLSVRLVDANGAMGSPIWSKKGNQGNSWHVGSIRVDRTDIKQVVFEAKRGRSARSDIALDFIQVIPGTV